MFPFLFKLINKYNSNDIYQLISIDPCLQITETDLLSIVEICGEELIYRFLFKDNLKGREYTLNDAANFIEWAKQEWRQGSHFVFLVKDIKGSIVACIDVFPSSPYEARIGYWATAAQPGIMTNTVKHICEMSREAGYEKLFALVEPGNTKSAGVLERAGFILTGSRMEAITFIDKEALAQISKVG